MTRSLGLIALTAAIVTAAPVGAETYKFKAPDGSTHFTNAPADPRYQRMGFTTGTGGSTAHNNMPPYLVLNFCIALQGIFPARP